MHSKPYNQMVAELGGITYMYQWESIFRQNITLRGNLCKMFYWHDSHFIAMLFVYVCIVLTIGVDICI